MKVFIVTYLINIFEYNEIIVAISEERAVQLISETAKTATYSIIEVDTTKEAVYIDL